MGYVFWVVDIDFCSLKCKDLGIREGSKGKGWNFWLYIVLMYSGGREVNERDGGEVDRNVIGKLVYWKVWEWVGDDGKCCKRN